MIRRTLLPSICFGFSSLIFLPSAQAGYLNIMFQGTVIQSVDESGELFDAGAGNGTVVGRTVTGSFLIDLDMAQTRSTDYEVGGDAYYSANQYLGPERYITSKINIGGRHFTLSPSVTSIDDEESVWMYRVDNPEFEGPAEYFNVQDEYFYENEAGLSSFSLSLSIGDILNSFLDPSLDLDQEFHWISNQHPDGSAGGRFAAEADVGIGAADFALHRVKASVVPTEVPEPATIGILLVGLLAVIGLRRRSWYR